MRVFLTHNPEDLDAYYGRALPELTAIAEVHRNPLDRDLTTPELLTHAEGCDVIVAHPSVLHGGGPTGPASRRRALTVRCYGADIVYAERPPTRPTVPLTPGLSLTHEPGDPLRSPWYPRLRPVPAHQRPD